ncbi:MAG: type II toxin-antitoxin system VapC family toxin [Chitinophagaceae bacterium]
MDRYLLDTNILVFLITDKTNDEICFEVREILKDFGSRLYASPVSIIERQQLQRIGKVHFRKNIKADDLVNILENDFYVSILPFTKQHSGTLLRLTVFHNDPSDHAIISHAITEKMTMVSSDKKFQEYTNQKLKFIYNKR